MTEPTFPPPHGSGSRPTYWWIQYLRGLAAAGVVIYHVYDYFPAPLGRSFEIGAHGVDVFFVISGFIMYSAARDERVIQFVSRRLIRVFPLYWLATLFLLLLELLILKKHPSGTETVLSLALIPHYSEMHRAEIWPILVPGWTLSYELLFYGLFALGIATRRVLAVPVVAIVALVALGALYKPHLAPLVVATSSLLLEFLLGLLIGLAVHRRPALLLGIVLAAVAVSLGSLVLDWNGAAVYAGAAAIVAGAVWLEGSRSRIAERRDNPSPRPIRSLRLLGEASYSIYLFHTPFLGVVSWLAGDSLAGVSELAANTIAVAQIAAALGIGLLFHKMLEKPLLRIFNGWNRQLMAHIYPQRT